MRAKEGTWGRGSNGAGTGGAETEDGSNCSAIGGINMRFDDGWDDEWNWHIAQKRLDSFHLRYHTLPRMGNFCHCAVEYDEHLSRVPHIVVRCQDLQLKRQNANCFPKDGDIIPTAFHYSTTHRWRRKPFSTACVELIKCCDQLQHVCARRVQDLQQDGRKPFVDGIHSIMLQALINL